MTQPDRMTQGQQHGTPGPPAQVTGGVQATPTEALDAKREKLRYYREEIRHEFNLLSNRVSAYITSQAFLVTGFALSLGNMNPRWGSLFRLVFPLALALLGIALSILVWPGIQGACNTIDLWHEKQEKVLGNDPSMNDYQVDRRVASSCQGRPVDVIHQRSLMFARWSPWVFVIAWSVFSVLAVVLSSVE